MKYWYKRDKNGRWIFCYSLNKEEQEVVDKVMPNAVRAFKGLPIKGQRMKIVIDIPEEDYKFIKDLQFYYSGRRNGKTIERNVINGIKNGTPYEARSTGEWIPVSERLPEDKELVLFSTKTDRVFEGRYFDDNTDRQWYSFRDDTFAWNNVVTAWMPLPEAYKEAENDE